MPRRVMAVCRSVTSTVARSSGLFTTLIRRADNAASRPMTLLRVLTLISVSSAASRILKATSGKVGSTRSSLSMAASNWAWTISASLFMVIL
ncbi:hypothetical protein D9M71_794960 [compost metagenome]